MAKVVWTAEAERWLLRIHDYIASDKRAAAFEVVESLYRRAEILVYLREPPDEVRILGVFHGAMDLKKYVP